MGAPKFTIGQTVMIEAPKLYGAPHGRFTIVRAMPGDRGQVQYRIKSGLETYERVVEERLLRAEEL